jgi:small subunit ribosomal protein S20
MAKQSSLKRARQVQKRNLRNKRAKRAFKSAIKKLDTAVNEKKDKKEITSLLNKAVSSIDKAVSKGVIHKKTAGRKKSQLTRKANNYLSGKSEK